MTREYGIEGGGAHPSKSAKGEAAGVGVVRKVGQPPRTILIHGHVPSSDANYRMVMIGMGNIIFGREVGASNEEKTGYYRQALARYQDAAALFPDDPRPLLYQGFCYERLTDIAQSSEEKRQQLVIGEAVLRRALTLKSDSPDYSPALPYRAMALFTRT